MVEEIAVLALPRFLSRLVTLLVAAPQARHPAMEANRRSADANSALRFPRRRC